MEAQMTLYDFKRAQMAKLPTLEKQGIVNGREMIETLNRKYRNLHYMMLCKEINYYTVFVSCPNHVCNDSFSEVVVECAQSVGEILDINFDETKSAVQIWVRNAPEEVHALMLFPYDAGVVQFGALA